MGVGSQSFDRLIKHQNLFFEFPLVIFELSGVQRRCLRLFHGWLRFINVEKLHVLGLILNQFICAGRRLWLHSVLGIILRVRGTAPVLLEVMCGYIIPCHTFLNYVVVEARWSGAMTGLNLRLRPLLLYGLSLRNNSLNWGVSVLLRHIFDVL